MADSERHGRESDIHDYVEAFRTSADRSRWSIYIVLVGTVLLFVTNYNLQLNNWPRRRIRTWYRYVRAADSKRVLIADPSPDVPAPETIVEGDPLRIAALREEYVKQFVGRALFTPSPIPGVSIDANDLGLLGGIALALVLLVLVFCISREHENLYLALYKVRLLNGRPGDEQRGDNSANLLYHALAMNQVLGSPPTLARWHSRGVLNHAWLVLFAPFGVHAWVVWTLWDTRKIAEAYGASKPGQLLPPAVVCAIVAVLCALAAAHARAMAMRWKRVFFQLNPHLKLVEPMNLREWLKIGRPTRKETLARAVTAQIVQRLSRPAAAGAKTEIKPIDRPRVMTPMSRAFMRQLSLEIVEQLPPGELSGDMHFQVSEALLDGDTLHVSGEWSAPTGTTR